MSRLRLHSALKSFCKGWDPLQTVWSCRITDDYIFQVMKKRNTTPQGPSTVDRGLNDSDRQIEGLEMRLVDVPTDQEGAVAGVGT